MKNPQTLHHPRRSWRRFSQNTRSKGKEWREASSVRRPQAWHPLACLLGPSATDPALLPGPRGWPAPAQRATDDSRPRPQHPQTSPREPRSPPSMPLNCYNYPHFKGVGRGCLRVPGEWPQQQELIPHLEARSLEPRCRQGCARSRGTGAGSFLLLQLCGAPGVPGLQPSVVSWPVLCASV